jgi:uncharacterized 2Fe-2S/4Fe-4S cluster protein (DUF4445 family)
MAYQIEFEPVGRRGECPEGSSLLDCARQLGVGLVSICGGQGKCLACKVQLLRGNVSPPTSTDEKAFSSEEIQQGWRLACMTYPQSDCTLHLPPESMTTTQRMQVEGMEVAVAAEPAVKGYPIKIVPPTLHDLRSDTTRVCQALKQECMECTRFDIDAIRKMSTQLREWHWEARVYVRESEIIALSPESHRPLGLAVDVGSTKIASYLVDLTTGQTLVSKGAMNPQISYGEDITSRMMNAMKSPAETYKLQHLVTDAINQLAKELCEHVKAKPEEIVDSCIVGNTAIHHLMLGLPFQELAYSPFVAAIQEPWTSKPAIWGFI